MRYVQQILRGGKMLIFLDMQESRWADVPQHVMSQWDNHMNDQRRRRGTFFFFGKHIAYILFSHAHMFI